ncbi:MAG: hypothetical protein ACUZ8H_16115 [Candidatus Anammoxibacter sp.]
MKKILLIMAISLLTTTHVTAQDRFQADTTIVDVFRYIDADTYSTPVYVYFTDIQGVIPRFKRDSLVILSNALTGYQVDSIYEVVAGKLQDEVNGN